MIQAYYTIAMAASPAEGGQTQQSPVFMFGWLVLMIGVFYFLMIRPQQKREKERRNMISNVKSGDKVVFSGGIIGTITNVKEKTFTIRIAEKTKVEVSRSAVSQVIGQDDEIEPIAENK